jgi:hypothetical protein
MQQSHIQKLNTTAVHSKPYVCHISVNFRTSKLPPPSQQQTVIHLPFVTSNWFNFVFFCRMYPN